MVAIAAAMALASCAANGQSTSGAPTNNSKNETSAAAFAQAMIDKIENGNLVFEISGKDSVRHIQSGMICSFAKAPPRSALTRLEISRDMPIGDGVSCYYKILDIVNLAIEVSRKPGQDSAKIIADMKKDILESYTGIKPVEYQSLNNNRLGPVEVAAFILPRDDGDIKTILSTTMVGGWSIEVVAAFRLADSADPPELIMAQRMGETIAALWILPAAVSVLEASQH
ncbi:hypothetical protein [Zavarzinia marina]|uniref:hypothetical protein n=1 Tax=Zavarzinia marina TaxID=2911065 RepID=UPI001F26F454|nr:hypothetical protein [Zavarzinia marina]